MGTEEKELWYQRWMSLLVTVRGGCRVERVLGKCVGAQIRKRVLSPYDLKDCEE